MEVLSSTSGLIPNLKVDDKIIPVQVYVNTMILSWYCTQLSDHQI
jgi:hypothetical protein